MKFNIGLWALTLLFLLIPGLQGLTIFFGALALGSTGEKVNQAVNPPTGYKQLY